MKQVSKSIQERSEEMYKLVSAAKVLPYFSYFLPQEDIPEEIRQKYKGRVRYEKLGMEEHVEGDVFLTYNVEKYLTLTGKKAEFDEEKRLWKTDDGKVWIDISNFIDGDIIKLAAERGLFLTKYDFEKNINTIRHILEQVRQEILEKLQSGTYGYHKYDHFAFVNFTKKLPTIWKISNTTLTTRYPKSEVIKFYYIHFGELDIIPYPGQEIQCSEYLLPENYYIAKVNLRENPFIESGEKILTDPLLRVLHDYIEVIEYKAFTRAYRDDYYRRIGEETIFSEGFFDYEEARTTLYPIEQFFIIQKQYKQAIVIDIYKYMLENFEDFYISYEGVGIPVQEERKITHPMVITEVEYLRKIEERKIKTYRRLPWETNKKYGGVVYLETEYTIKELRDVCNHV